MEKYLRLKQCIILLLLLFITSCKTAKTVYVPVETVKTEYVASHDSIYIQDSIYYYVEYKKDTIRILDYKYKIIYKNKVDTILRIDTIPTIKEVEKFVVTNLLYWWLKDLMYVGIAAIVLVALYIFIKIYCGRLL